MKTKARPRKRNIRVNYKIINIPQKPRESRGKINYAARLKFVRAFVAVAPPSKKKIKSAARRQSIFRAKINKEYSTYKDYKKSKVLTATPAKIKELKKAGFKTCPRGVIIPEIFENQSGQPVNGDIKIRGGAIVEIYKERVDIYYQFHGNQKLRFLKNPDDVISEILRELQLPASRENLSIHLLYGHLIGKFGREIWKADYFKYGDDHQPAKSKRKKRERSAKTKEKRLKEFLTGIRIVTNKARYEKETKSKKRQKRKKRRRS